MLFVRKSYFVVKLCFTFKLPHESVWRVSCQSCSCSGDGAFGGWSVSGSGSGGVVRGGAPARVPSIAWRPPPPADGAVALSVGTVRGGERGNGDRILSTESQPGSTGGPFAGAASGGVNRVMNAESQLGSASGPFIAVAESTV